VIPKLFEAHPNRPIRIWSAASSTGQEIYSIAILLSEFAETHPTISYELLATDLSPRVLARAESGRYMDLEVRRGLTDVQLSKFFDRCSDEGDACTWKIKPDLRKHLQFQSLNLISTWPASIGQFDLILCRNVLIYQTVQQKQKVVANLAKHLAKTGYLILGGAESLVGISQDFAQEQVDGAIVYRFIAPP
jgi:chemotaxis protein methyltransferase CheR